MVNHSQLHASSTAPPFTLCLKSNSCFVITPGRKEWLVLDSKMGMCVHITEWVGSLVCMALFGLVNRIEKGKKRDESLIIKEQECISVPQVV